MNDPKDVMPRATGWLPLPGDSEMANGLTLRQFYRAQALPAAAIIFDASWETLQITGKQMPEHVADITDRIASALLALDA